MPREAVRLTLLPPLALVLTLALTVPSQRSASAGVQDDAYTHNLAGGDATFGISNGYAANWYSDRVQDTAPRVVAGQEVCSAGYTVMINRLYPLGYVGRRIVTDGATAYCTGDTYRGNVIFVKGGESNLIGDSYHIYNEQSGGDTSRGEARSAQCLTTNALNSPYVGCTTHLSNYDVSAGIQVDELLYFVESPPRSDWRRTVGGDFNLPSESSQLNPFYDSWVEADDQRFEGRSRTFEDGRKIDFVFSKGYTRYRAEATPYSPYSDHLALRGFIEAK